MEFIIATGYDFVVLVLVVGPRGCNAGATNQCRVRCIPIVEWRHHLQQTPTDDAATGDRSSFAGGGSSSSPTSYKRGNLLCSLTSYIAPISSDLQESVRDL